MSKTRKLDEFVTDPKVALEMLKSGNERFVSGKPLKREIIKDLKVLTEQGQKPFAVILTCSDSRTAPEIFFDTGLGDIFVIRSAGNYADAGTLGYIEFAVKHLKAPLVLVVGHTHCGAVINAHQNATGLSEMLQKVLDHLKQNVKGATSDDEAMTANVAHNVNLIKENPVIKELNTPVLGADFNITTGVVTLHNSL
ncbi:MAG: carbonic anhydrase [Firmicutes bacterium]|nr:carbonic anhydrase [Bacillota bacterium]